MTPGEGDLARAELLDSDEALQAAATLIETGTLRSAASRIYYAMFHAARAALTVNGIHARTHSGTVLQFEQRFGPAREFHDAFELRGEADYGTGAFQISADRIGARLEAATGFVERCRAIVEDALSRGPDEPDPPADL